jgi:hypothetical protein
MEPDRLALSRPKQACGHGRRRLLLAQRRQVTPSGKAIRRTRAAVCTESGRARVYVRSPAVDIARSVSSVVV